MTQLHRSLRQIAGVTSLMCLFVASCANRSIATDGAGDGATGDGATGDVAKVDGVLSFCSGQSRLVLKDQQFVSPSTSVLIKNYTGDIVKVDGDVSSFCSGQ